MSLRSGSPDKTLLAGAAQLLLKAANHKIAGDIEKDEFTCYNYSTFQCDPFFQEQLAKYLTEEYGSAVRGCDLYVTSGATHALHLVSSIVVSPCDGVLFIEDPTYFRTLSLLRSLNYKLVSVASDDYGIIPDELVRLVEKYYPGSFTPTDDRPYRALIYITPIFHNPLGYVYPRERYMELIKVAREHDLLLFCDDVYSVLYFDEAQGAPPRMFEMDDRCADDYKGSVISCNSFSKSLAPSLRCGWMEAPKSVIDILLKNTEIMCQFTSGILAASHELGLLREATAINRRVYAMKMGEALLLLEKLLPPDVTFNRPQGGFYIWVSLPNHLQAKDLMTTEKEYSLSLSDGADFSVNPGGYSNCLRLSISSLTSEDLVGHMTRFCECVHRFLEIST